jgi:folate-binding protein YgfZ
MSNISRLTNRSLIYLCGKDSISFLQGLVSNDVTKASEEKAIYSLMLNPQGRFLYEFFIIRYKDGLILETCSGVVDDLVRKLGFYKLRSEVEISKIEDKEVFFIDNINEKISNNVVFLDPRKESFGLRCYAKREDLLIDDIKEKDLNFYNNLRLRNKIVDENDLIFDKSIVAEYGFDNLNAIDYEKGCYVGQEVVARAHYKGIVRKKIFLVQIDNIEEIEKDTEITCDGKKQGVILSSLFYDNKLIALALIKNLNLEGEEVDLNSLDLVSSEQKITIKE